jgi:hypothetical protein
LTVVTLFALGLAACGDDDRPPPPAPPPRDFGVDAPPPMDAGPELDAEVDASTDLDASTEFDASSDFDAASPEDLGPSDAGDPPDFPDFGPPPKSCTGPTGEYDACACEPLAFSCDQPGDAPCPAGTVCLDTGCGRSFCQRAGTGCVDAADCAPGASCVPVSAGLNVCFRPEAPCADSRECPGGFSCEGEGLARRCIDRRIPCTYRTACPFGFTCRVQPGIVSFCERVYVRCNANEACAGDACLDVDGDGLRECGYAGCTATSECGTTEQCAFDPERITQQCGPHGVCTTDTECGPGNVCLDVWGDGVKQCELATSSCAAGGCPFRQLCGSRVSGGEARCLAAP